MLIYILLHEGEQATIELHVKKYCHNCTEFEPETQVDVLRAYSDGITCAKEKVISVNTVVTCTHAQRCECCIREFIEKGNWEEVIE